MIYLSTKLSPRVLRSVSLMVLVKSFWRNSQLISDWKIASHYDRNSVVP